jgi:hypothetical protein
MKLLKPNKYTNIDLSVLGLSTEILTLLKKEKSQKYNQIFEKVIYKKGAEAKENFLLSLSFLYLLGKIKYYQKQDVIELLVE